MASGISISQDRLILTWMGALLDQVHLCLFPCPGQSDTTNPQLELQMNSKCLGRSFSHGPVVL